MISKRLILWYFFFIAITIALIFFLWVYALPVFLASILIYSCIAFIVHRVWATIKHTHKKSFSEFFIIFLYKFSILTSIVLLFLGSFVVFQMHIFPAKMPTYTLTNGEKNVVFQTMSHVASESFYEEVVKKITSAKKWWYVLFYEWVRPWSKENHDKFDAALGVSLTPETYDTMAKLYNISAQNNNDFLWLINNKDYNVDISIDEIIEKYEKNFKQGNSSQQVDTLIWVHNIEDELNKRLEDISSRQLFLLRYINASIMSFMIKHDFIRDALLSSMWKEDIFSVILNDRNKVLANELINTNEDKIIIIYGLMHFEGVLELLKENDSNWRIIHESNTRLIYPPNLEV